MKHYVIFVDVGYGHEEAIHFSSEPEHLLKTAYEAFLESESNESVFNDDVETYLDWKGLPKIYEISEVDVENSELFVKIWKELE